MQVLYQKKHLNSLKLLLACKFTDQLHKIECCKNKLPDGAVLKLTDSFNMRYELSGSGAVLRLIPPKDDSKIIEWVEWGTALQERLRLLASSNKSLQYSEESLANNDLKFLEDQILKPNYLVKGVLSAADIVLFCCIFQIKSMTKLLEVQKFKKINQYFDFLHSHPDFKECLSEFTGGEKIIPVLSTFPEIDHSQPLWSSSKSGTNSNESSERSDDNLSESEIAEAERRWNETENSFSVKHRQTPVLPVEGQANILITSALPYVNNVPHLGNIIGSVLSADCFSRFCRIKGINALYVCGTDEYGTATETKALSENLTCQQICDKYHAIHAQVYKWFNIEFDYFGRTTTKSQTTASQHIFNKLQQKDLIRQNQVDQLYCEKCLKFLADRFVEGTCPNPGCKYTDARGDQCDSCGKLVNATDLIDPRCKVCSNTPVQRTSNHLFLDLPKIEPDLKAWMESTSAYWASNAKVICESWIKDGLKERCITRDLKWGTPVPLKGFTDKVFYVWFDAPIGYISITMEYTDQWEKWWKNTENIQFYQFMAKDNVPFHGIIFPSCLLGTGESWTTVTNIVSTEYLNYEGGKFSKSRGVGVFGDQVQETGIPSDVWRFYLLYIRPENQDTVFSWSDLQFKNNSELLNNLGNFVNRALKFVYQFYAGIVPPSKLNLSDYRVIARVNRELSKYISSLTACKLRDGIRSILSISRIGNQFIQENEPYKLIKSDRSAEERERGASVISLSVNIVALIGVLLFPYMPENSRKILTYLNLPKDFGALPVHLKQFLKPGHKILEPSPLITKITDDQIEALRARYGGSAESESNVAKPKCKDQQVKTPNSNPEQNADEIQKVQAMITEQGDKVREMKKSGADKNSLSEEIEVLLSLKEKLAVLQGIDPATIRKPKKNKK